MVCNYSFLETGEEGADSNKKLKKKKKSPIISKMVKLMNHQDAEIRSTCIQGFCKLFFHGKLTEHKILSQLILELFSPVTAGKQYNEIRSILTVRFFLTRILIESLFSHFFWRSPAFRNQKSARKISRFFRKLLSLPSTKSFTPTKTFNFQKLIYDKWPLFSCKNRTEFFIEFQIELPTVSSSTKKTKRRKEQNLEENLRKKCTDPIL